MDHRVRFIDGDIFTLILIILLWPEPPIHHFPQSSPCKNWPEKILEPVLKVLKSCRLYGSLCLGLGLFGRRRPTNADDCGRGQGRASMGRFDSAYSQDMRQLWSAIHVAVTEGRHF